MFDPPWVNDEGTYFAVAQAAAHGYRLYADIWENKPPGIYLLYSAVYHVFGPSLLAIRLLTCAAVLLLVVLVFRIACREVSPSLALIAALLVGLLFAVPLLEGTTGNAESFLAPLTTLAVYLVMVREQPFPAGIAVGLAVLFKVVAGFDAAAIGLWLLLHRRPLCAPYLAALGTVLAGASVLAWLDGILPALLKDAVLYDLGYVGHANGGAVPWIVILKLAALALLTLAVRNRPFPYLWLCYAAAGALISGRFFQHYALQAVAPLVLALVLLLRNRPLPYRRILMALPATFLALAALASAAGWVWSQVQPASTLGSRLQYYGHFAEYAAGGESYVTYRKQVDSQVDTNIRVAAELRRLPPGYILVWGNVPWVYVLSGRLPATPYTSAYRQPAVPGETGTLSRTIRSGSPSEVVVVRPPLPPLGSAEGGLRTHYRLVMRIGNEDVYVSRQAALDARSMARAAASASKGTR